jgi:hypothetical protein
MPYEPRIPMVGTTVPRSVLDRLSALEDGQASLSAQSEGLDDRVTAIEQEIANAFVVADYHLDPNDDPQTTIPAGQFADLALSEILTPAFVARAVSGAWAFDGTTWTAPEGAFYRVYISGALHVASGAPLEVTLQGVFNGSPLPDVFTVLPANNANEPVGFALTWLQRAFLGPRQIKFRAAHTAVISETLELDSLQCTLALRYRNEGGVVALP